MQKVLTIFGTRPEAIKMAPVVRALEAAPDFESLVCVTGQHRQMLDQMLGFFGIRADRDLALMRPDQTLTDLTARTLETLQPVFEDLRPDWVLVQGDTATAMAASLAAYYARIKVGHIEAGLRTGDKYAPFPEEVNRRIIGVIADAHFAPTAVARDALLAESKSAGDILITGNTGIDSLFWTRERLRAGAAPGPAGLETALDGRRLVLVTAHRRENFDGGLEEICRAIRAITEAFPDVAVVLPVHPNPNVKGPIETQLSDAERVHLVAPFDYPEFVWLLDRAHLILTDSGGVQEEATALGKPMLIMREVTERPEAVSHGPAELVGARSERIITAAAALLSEPALYARTARASDVFGDGAAAQRIVESLRGRG